VIALILVEKIAANNKLWLYGVERNASGSSRMKRVAYGLLISSSKAIQRTG
jgi:hypothetical protein